MIKINFLFGDFRWISYGGTSQGISPGSEAPTQPNKEYNIYPSMIYAPCHKESIKGFVLSGGQSR